MESGKVFHELQTPTSLPPPLPPVPTLSSPFFPQGLLHRRRGPLLRCRGLRGLRTPHTSRVGPNATGTKSQKRGTTVWGRISFLLVHVVPGSGEVRTATGSTSSPPKGRKGHWCTLESALCRETTGTGTQGGRYYSALTLVGTGETLRTFPRVTSTRPPTQTTDGS